jgi:hypothetical protein
VPAMTALALEDVLPWESQPGSNPTITPTAAPNKATLNPAPLMTDPCDDLRPPRTLQEPGA